MKKAGKVLAAFTAAALAFGVVGMAGCSSSDTKADDSTVYEADSINAQDITVTNSGYSVHDVEGLDADGNSVMNVEANYAFLVENPNTGYVAQNVPFSINAYNAAGETVFSAGNSVMYLYPGITTAVSGTTTFQPTDEIDQTVTTFEVVPVLTGIEYLKTGLSNGEIADMFKVNNPEVTENPEGDAVGSDQVSYTVSASISGDLADGTKIFKVADLENTLEGHAVAVFTDAEGNIVYGTDPSNILIDETTADMLKQTTEDGSPMSNFSVSLSWLPEYQNFQIYVMPGL